jgi:hypothetical protein
MQKYWKLRIGDPDEQHPKPLFPMAFDSCGDAECRKSLCVTEEGLQE